MSYPKHNDRTTHLQACIDRLQQGDEAARAELIEGACHRLRVLTSTMLRGDRIGRWEQTDDVMQQAMICLQRTLEECPPQTVRDFMRLAAFQIRRTLIQLARHYFRPYGLGTNHLSNPNADTSGALAWLDTPADDATPSQVASQAEQWERLHGEIERLPDEDREVVELIWFHDLKQSEVADLTSVTVRTVQRRWIRARLTLFRALGGTVPGTSHD